MEILLCWRDKDLSLGMTVNLHLWLKLGATQIVTEGLYPLDYLSESSVFGWIKNFMRFDKNGLLGKNNYQRAVRAIILRAHAKEVLKFLPGNNGETLLKRGDRPYT